jgi:hypothetical protein
MAWGPGAYSLLLNKNYKLRNIRNNIVSYKGLNTEQALNEKVRISTTGLALLLQSNIKHQKQNPL